MSENEFSGSRYHEHIQYLLEKYRDPKRRFTFFKALQEVKSVDELYDAYPREDGLDPRRPSAEEIE